MRATDLVRFRCVSIYYLALFIQSGLSVRHQDRVPNPIQARSSVRKNILGKVEVVSGGSADTGFTTSRRCITGRHQSELDEAVGEWEVLPILFVGI